MQVAKATALRPRVRQAHAAAKSASNNARDPADLSAKVSTLTGDVLLTPDESSTEDNEVATPLSRRQRRQLRKQGLLTPPPSSSRDASDTEPASEEQHQKQREKRRRRPPADDEASSPMPRLPVFPSLTVRAPSSPILPLLICSIGNPAPAYTNTLHSAGHTILQRISALRKFHPFTPDPALAPRRSGALVSRPARVDFSVLPWGSHDTRPRQVRPRERAEGEDHWTLWQSGALMNASGRGVRDAWDAWRRELGAEGGRLVVLHDELEVPLGAVRVRAGAASARGHNGLRSVAEAMRGSGEWVRVGVGIGRPKSREPDEVARYVLRKMTEGERRVVEDAAGDVIEQLRRIEDGFVP